MQQCLERTNDAEKEEGRTAKAQQIGQPMKIAVVDSGRNLLSYVRMGDAWIGSIAISINKAFTARAFDTETARLAKNSQPCQELFGVHVFGIHTSNHGGVMSSPAAFHCVVMER